MPDCVLICERKLFGKRDGIITEALVSLYVPIFDDARKCWTCRFAIPAIGPHQPDAGHGEDAFQALIIAIQGIGKTLDATGHVWCWFGGDTPHFDDDGFPRYLPSGYGMKIVRQLEAMVEREMNRASKSGELRQHLKDMGLRK